MESLPDLTPKHSKVQVRDSAGAGGPDGRRRSAFALALLLLIVGGAVLAYFAWSTGRI